MGALSQQLCLIAKGVEITSGGTNSSRHNINTPKDTIVSSPLPRADGAEDTVTPELMSVLSTHRSLSSADWFNCLVRSLCPAIYGHEMTKAVLLLALLGGRDKEYVRSQIHVLLVGDPGIGKSQLLRAVANCSVRSAYVSASASSTCGLTLSVSRDASNETSFEPGAVVHGDGGVTCIDEIDKSPSEHRALLEVMEQQTLSIAKAGLIFSLPVKTTIIAAGNPVGGRYSPLRTLSDNTNLSWPLLSRFDFILVLADQVKGGALETKLADHVLSLHRPRQRHDDDSRDEPDRSGDEHDSRPLTLSRQELTQFLTYARDHCKPVLAADAKACIREWYLDARRKRDTSELPVTVRLLQATIRAAEARAKADLSPLVTAAHAQDAVDLLKRGRQSQIATHDGFATGVTGGGGTASKKGGRANLRDEAAMRLKAIMNAEGRTTVSHQEIVDLCASLGAKNPAAMVEQLNSFGVILQQSASKYRLTGKLL